MPDLIRITTPLVNKTQPVQQKPGVEPTEAFNINNSTIDLQTRDKPSELVMQNSGLLEGNDIPTLLLNLLKDPGVTVSYMKSIIMLEELFKLLPADNEMGTKEPVSIIQSTLLKADGLPQEVKNQESVVDSMMIKAEGLPQEMKNQEKASTIFKGEIFDFLRNVSGNNSAKPEVQIAIAKFLRAIYSMGNQREILDSIGNNLNFLKKELSSSPEFSQKLERLILGFKTADSQNVFSDLKAQTLELLKDIQSNNHLTAKSTEIVAIIKYNLSRYSGNSEDVLENAFRLLEHFTPQEKRQFYSLFDSLISELREAGSLSRSTVPGDDSKVITLIAELIAKQSESGKMSSSVSDKLEGMLHSLLLSPTNFTPLLHFILPLQNDQMRAFAEIWINPESDDKEKAENHAGGIHILMVVEIESVGRFEAEFYVHNSTIDFMLYCPEGSESNYHELIRSMPKIIYGTEYHMGKTQVAPLVKTRSLMEVFKSLPHREVGVDVKA